MEALAVTALASLNKTSLETEASIVISQLMLACCVSFRTVFSYVAPKPGGTLC
jgi:hypothetical protein